MIETTPPLDYMVPPDDDRSNVIPIRGAAVSGEPIEPRQTTPESQAIRSVLETLEGMSASEVVAAYQSMAAEFGRVAAHAKHPSMVTELINSLEDRSPGLLEFASTRRIETNDTYEEVYTNGVSAGMLQAFALLLYMIEKMGVEH